MRSVTFTVTRAGGFHPTTYELLASEPGLTREAILHSNALDDGTVVGLTRFSGDPDRARQLIDQRSDVIDYSVSNAGEGKGLAYVHSRPPESIRWILDLSREHEVFLDFPLERVRENEIRATMIGETNDALQRALAAIPDDVTVTVEQIGAYSPDMSDISGLLTDRQQEILEIAMDLGYYTVPRQATSDDIAERVGLDASTVSEHLRKIEARTFAALAG